jgi:hypothetical protein
MYLQDVDDDAREALVESLVAEALEGFDGVVSETQLEVIRAMLEEELLFSEEGRRLVRQLMPDPVVGASGDVVREPGEPPRKEKASGDR